MHLFNPNTYNNVEDLLADTSFCRYCIGSDPKAVSDWNAWLSRNPDKEQIVKEARRIYFILNGEITDQDFQEDLTAFRGLVNGMGGKVVELNKVVAPKKRAVLSRGWQWAAAAIVACLFAGSYYFLSDTSTDHSSKSAVAVAKEVEISPGGNKAILTLADGTRVVLDSLQNGAISTEGNVKVIKLQDGQLSYNKSLPGNDSHMIYNTISTPRGGQYQVALSDGSKVWLNAASSLSYPVSFKGGSRMVELTGEGYFEVAHDGQKPFIVKSGNAAIEVLGTQFNVNSYPEEDMIRATLLSGKVKVLVGGQSAILSPGNQARINYSDDQLAVLKHVDVDAVIAWKNGYFDFNGLKLPELMRQVSRWYDVEVLYDGEIPDLEFGGKLQRSLPFSSMVQILKMSKVNVDVQNKHQITIKP